MEELTLDGWKDVLFEMVRANFTMMDESSKAQRAAIGILFKQYDDKIDVCSMFAANSVDWFRRKAVEKLFGKSGVTALDMAEASALIECLGKKNALGYFELSEDGVLMLDTVVEELENEYPRQTMLQMSIEAE